MTKRAAKEGATYVCSTWGYVMERHQGKWVRQHRLVMERFLKRPLLRVEVVHHKNGEKTDNRLENLELMTPADHTRKHALGLKHSSETREKLRAVAVRRVADPLHRASLSKRAKQQHASGKLGRATWKPGSSPDPEVMRQHGLKQADRLQQMAKTISSEEMRRRSYQRKMFKGRTE